MIKIFVSYSSKDKHLAGEIKRAFEKHTDIKCFIAHDDIIPGSKWEQEILFNLKDCEYFMPLQTENLTKSYWCQQEAGICLERGVNIIPLIPDINGNDPIGFYSVYQGYPIKISDIGASIDKLIELKKLLEEARKKMHEERGQAGVSYDSALIVSKEFLRTQLEQLRQRFGDKPYYILSASPIPLIDDVLDVGSNEVMDVFKTPTYHRHQSGWDMQFGSHNVKPTIDGLLKNDGQDNDCGWQLRMFRNGYIDFSALVDYVFSWGQGEVEYKKSPRFNAHAIIEFPASFFRFIKELIHKFGIPSSLYAVLEIRNCGIYELGAYHPDSIWHRIGGSVKKANMDNFFIEKTLNPLTMESDAEAFYFVERLYNHFGLTRDKIPFFDAKFQFEIKAPQK